MKAEDFNVGDYMIIRSARNNNCWELCYIDGKDEIEKRLIYTVERWEWNNSSMGGRKTSCYFSILNDYNSYIY